MGVRGIISSVSYKMQNNAHNLKITLDSDTAILYITGVMN